MATSGLRRGVCLVSVAVLNVIHRLDSAVFDCILPLRGILATLRDELHVRAIATDNAQHLVVLIDRHDLP